MEFLPRSCVSARACEHCVSVCVCLCSTEGVFALMGTCGCGWTWQSASDELAGARLCVVRLLKRTSVCYWVSICHCTFAYVCNWCVSTCAHVDCVCIYLCRVGAEAQRELLLGSLSKGPKSELEIRAACPQEKDAKSKAKMPWFSCYDTC